MKTFISLLLSYLLLSLAIQDASAQFWNKKQPELLPGEQAFAHDVRLKGTEIVVDWIIADDYYMYRDQFGVKDLPSGVKLGTPDYPVGEMEDDPEFGEVMVYWNLVTYRLPILELPDGLSNLQFTLEAQGCNKPVGVCYPPQFRPVTIDVSKFAFNAGTTSQTEPSAPGNSTSGSGLDSGFSGFQQSDESKSYWAYILAAFGAGLLLSFTPCVLPMIPILAGVIAGQTQPSRLRSGWLAVCYVAGTVVTYAIAGWIAGASGIQLQAKFQNPWVVGSICLLLIGLAASLFGLFKIQLPSSIQTRLHTTQVSSKSATWSAFVLGLISALVVGACVSPILILNLGAAIAQADPVLGASIMGFMALGMGMLLIAFGFGAGWLLPRVGAWMNQIQILFGFMVLGVAIYLASFVPVVPALLLWAALFLWSGFYLFRLASSPENGLARSLMQAVGAVLIVWGALSLVGYASKGTDVLNPLSGLSLSGEQKQKIAFKRVSTLSAAKTLLQQAKAEQQATFVDFYADWCLDCLRMARTTFTEPEVHSALQDWMLIEVDVTDSNTETEALKKFFDVFGPPASIFIDPQGREYSELRQYGYMTKTEFLARLQQAN